MARNRKQEQQPFHESILVAIKRVRSKAKLEDYARIIVATKVPAGHSEIIEALRRKAIVFNVGRMPALKKAICLLREQETEKAEKTKRNPKNLLFPGPFMEKGSTGPAVGILQIILLTLGCNDAIKIDMGFGDETEKGLKVLQERYGLEVEGKCGPDTREKIREETGIDLNVLPADLFKGETVTVPPEPWVELPMP